MDEYIYIYTAMDLVTKRTSNSGTVSKNGVPFTNTAR